MNNTVDMLGNLFVATSCMCCSRFLKQQQVMNVSR
jgi:hypothetical protein